QGRNVPPSKRGIEYRLGCRGDQETDPRSDLPTFDHPCGLSEIFQRAIGAGPDKRLLDRLAGDVVDWDGIVDHRIRQGDEWLEIVEIYCAALGVLCVVIGILRRERDGIALPHIINQPLVRLEGSEFRTELGTHRRQGAARINAETWKGRTAKLDILVGVLTPN